jgi:alpha-L-rhamnosidase
MLKAACHLFAILAGLVWITFCSPALAEGLDGFAIGRATTNGRVNPLGLPAGEISFSWAATSGNRGVIQQAYEIRVGTQPGWGDVWASGEVQSARQVDIPLPPTISLHASTRYHWQVRAWNGEGQASAWSEPAWFETGLLAASDWSGAEWIARTVQSPDPAAWTDYTATVEFTLQSQAFGVFLRSSADARDAYMMQVNVTGSNPVFRPHKRTNGGYSVLATVNLAPLGFTNASLTGSRNTLRFEVSGSTITTRLNGVLIDTRTGIAYPSGLVGFRTFEAEAGAVHRVEVLDQPSSATLINPDFPAGENGFSGGVISNGSLTVSGTSDVVYANLPPSLPLLRGSFTAREGITSARVYASAQGLYEVSINGQKAGDQFLAPGWTDYDARIQSQTYDITNLVQPGANVIGAALADGWHRGSVGLNWTKVYGSQLAFVAKIKVSYLDGSSEWFATGLNWKAGDGPYVQGDNQDGETYNANLERPGWDTTGFDDSGWATVGTVTNASDRLVPQPDEPVRAVMVLTAKSRVGIAPATWLYDLGQNMVGVPRIRLAGTAGLTITLRHGEEIYRTGPQTGRLYTENLRSAKATDTYTFAADGTTIYQPKFTQHGFRYIEITGTDAPPEIADVQGVVLSSDLANIGDLETSHPLLNQLVSNIRWGQRGNFLSIPTDTPARDERLGWTGDISVFAPAAARYQDTRAFLSKWMADVRDSQKGNGNIPAIVPQPGNEFDATGVGWSDAVITVPYAVWRAFGDEKILRENWDAMKAFHAFVHNSATGDGDLLEQGRSSWFSGDWLTLESVNRLEEHKVIGTAYFAENTRMMAEMAVAMGETSQAAEWAALVPQIRAAFVDAYRAPDGTIYTGTQTAYAMALGMDMIADPAQRAQTAGKFIGKLAADNYHLKTGFLGTPWLLPALSKIGRDDLGMRLLLNETYPSWGFPITMGATTMWERWNSIQPSGEFGPVDMNSFNHYAYGAVGDWMFANLGGIQAVEPGYKTTRIAPLVGYGGLTQARCSQQTPFGSLATEWSVSGGNVHLHVEVPVNTGAIIHLPRSAGSAVMEGSVAAAASPGVQFLRTENGANVYSVGSGTYEFEWVPALEAPVLLEAVPASKQVSLSWSATPGATGYDVKRSMIAGGPYTAVATNLPTTSYTDTGLANGVTYHYVISAKESVVESVNSGELSALPAMLADAGFERPVTASYQYNPAGESWAFSGESGVAANESTFTSNNDDALEGLQAAFLQGTGSISRTLSGLTPGVTYEVIFSAAQRTAGASWNLDGQTWRLTLDGNTVADFTPGQSATAWAGYRATFTATAGSHTLAFVGTNLRSGDNTVFLDDVRLVRSSPSGLPLEGGFETPATGTFIYDPAGSAWTFSPESGGSGSGVARNGSLFTANNPAAPEGVQVAFVQRTGSLSQNVGGLVPGATYHLLFSAAQRTVYVNGGQTWQVAVDGNTIASYQPGASPTAYSGYCATFTASGTSHSLAFVGTNTNSGDNTVFIDDVRLVPASMPAPTGLVATGGILQATLQWTPVEGATGYLIKRSTAGGSASVVAWIETPATFVDTGLTAGTSYTYTVSALDETGPGHDSNPASATPGAPPVSDSELRAPAIQLTPDGSGGVSAQVTVKDSVIGHGYLLQFSDDLSPGGWQGVPFLDPQAGTGGDLQFVAPIDPQQPRRFYRILISL